MPTDLGQGSLPQIDVSGTVAFDAGLGGFLSHSRVIGYYTGDDILHTATVAEFFDPLGGTFSLSHDGLLAFRGPSFGSVDGAGFPENAQIDAYDANDGSASVLAYQVLDSGSAFPFDSVRGLAVNDNKEVAFSDVDNFYSGEGNGTIPAAGYVAGRGYLDPRFLDMADDGTIVANGHFSVSGTQEIDTINNGVFTTLETAEGPNAVLQGVSINEADTVAFALRSNSGTWEVLKSAAGGSLIPYVDDSGPFSDFDFVSINDNGVVAFRATLRAGGSGIFTGPDPATDKVIATGDPLFGSQVKSVSISSRSLNDSGQLAFEATLADGRTVIAPGAPLLLHRHQLE